MKKIALFLTLGVSAAGLSACGGGSGNDETTTTYTTTIVNESLPNNQATDTGSASSRFVAGANGVGFLMASLSSTTTGSGVTATSVPFTQTTDGALTTLSSFSLTGTPSATQDISGDATYALGRWSYGTVLQNDASIGTMNQSTNAFWHYIAFNLLPALPTSGTYTCGSATFTEPSYTGNLSAQTIGVSYIKTIENSLTNPILFLGNSTGVASLAFGTAGANVSVNITTTVGSNVGTASLDTTIASGTVFKTATSPNVIALGDAGNGAVRIAGFYHTTVTGGAIYQGIFQFSCHA